MSSQPISRLDFPLHFRCSQPTTPVTPPKMCRWFAYLGNEPALLEDVLINPSHSIIRQIDSHFLPRLHSTYSPHRQGWFNQASDDPGNPNLLTNVDGFGVGYYTEAKSDFEVTVTAAHPVTYKSVRPPLNDLNLRVLAANTSTMCVFTHIRAATGLTPVVETNNHPFIFGRYVFMHNGVVASFADFHPQFLQKLSKKAQTNVLGTTDSEHVAALFFTHLCPDDDWECDHTIAEFEAAMQQTIADLLAFGKEVGTTKPHSLNFAVTDGTRLLATRFSSQADHEPPTLYFSTTAGATLNRKYPDHPDGPLAKKVESKLKAEEHAPHVVVASEPNTYKVYVLSNVINMKIEGRMEISAQGLFCSGG